MDTKATVLSSSMVTDQKAARKRVKMRLAGADFETFDLVVDGDVAPAVGTEVTLTIAVKGAKPKREGDVPALGIRNDQVETRNIDEAVAARAEREAAEHRVPVGTVEDADIAKAERARLTAEGRRTSDEAASEPVGTVGGQTSKTGR